MNDKKIVEASYILSFYTNVSTLTSLYARYYNLIMETEYKHGEKSKNISDEETTAINKTLQELRMIIMITYVQYQGIKAETKFDKDSEIKDAYHELVTKYVLNRDGSLATFVHLINTFLVQDTMSNLFDKSQEIIDNLKQ